MLGRLQYASCTTRREVEQQIGTTARNVGNILVLRERADNSLRRFDLSQSNECLASPVKSSRDGGSSFRFTFSADDSSLLLLLSLLETHESIVFIRYQDNSTFSTTNRARSASTILSVSNLRLSNERKHTLLCNLLRLYSLSEFL